MFNVSVVIDLIGRGIPSFSHNFQSETGVYHSNKCLRVAETKKIKNKLFQKKILNLPK
jgi:hypothetical protein